MAAKKYLAIDLGASSGRAMVGAFDGGRLELSEVLRFPNEPVTMAGTLYWDLPRIYSACIGGINRALSLHDITSVGIDTWGVDYGLIDAEGRVMGNPVHYRDLRTDAAAVCAEKRFGLDRLYRLTGIAHQKFNTVFQLMAEPRYMIDNADRLLFMPDLLIYLLTGVKAAEFTIASTSQLLSAGTHCFSREILALAGAKESLFPEMVYPGSYRGDMRGTGLRVVSAASHDTASAVAAAPFGKGGAYLSSGTWSLIGVIEDKPVLTDNARLYNFTNEGAADGKTRFLRNIMGMWIIQECAREWAAKGESISWDGIAAAAAGAKPFARFIDPDDDMFYSPGDMPAKIAKYCAATGQKAPEGIGETARTVYESLAMKYRWALEKIAECTGRRPDSLNIVGGGCNNALLNRMTANAAGVPVYAGPAEATAAGNILVQAMADGELTSAEDIKEAVRRSFDIKCFMPEDTAVWNENYERFREITE